MNFLKQNYVKYGLIMTAGLIVCLLWMELSGNNQSFDNKSPIFFIYQFVYPAIVWYFGIKARKDAQKGKLTFSQGLSEGFKISVIFGLTSPFLFAAYYILFNSAILTFIKTAYGLSQVSDLMIVLVDSLAQFVVAIIFGSIYAAVISFFLKSKSK